MGAVMISFWWMQRIPLGAEPESFVLHANAVLSGDDDVVEQFDVHYLSGLSDLPGYQDVRSAWCGVSGCGCVRR